jgi:membrane-associated protease RseP (regulator of RpoE activity)
VASSGDRSRPADRSQPREDVLDGVEVTDLSGRARQQFDIPNTVRGALITNVDSGSAAYEAGLRPGDLIQEIDHDKILYYALEHHPEVSPSFNRLSSHYSTTCCEWVKSKI